MFDYIETYTNRRFHFLDPQPEEISIIDIARALSMSCRYTGHVNNFYSVAEHSVILADYVYQTTKDPEQALSALMHDASEAYLTDVPAPIKPYLTNYEELESRVQSAIEKKWNIQPANDLIKCLDKNIVADEAAQVYETVPDWVRSITPVGIEIICLTPAMAEAEFQHRWVIYASMRANKRRGALQ